VIDDKTSFLEKESGVFCFGVDRRIDGKKQDLTPVYSLRQNLILIRGKDGVSP
jgi:hypothetical protein